MLLWINGPFGGGKTQTAHELLRRLPGGFVADPERVGFGLHGMTPKSLRTDFQTYPAWRQGVFEALDRTLRSYRGVVIAPMTVVEPRYFEETVGRLREAGHEVRHFALLAERETVLRRLRERGLGRGLKSESFAVGMLDRCLEGLRDPMFAEHIRTDGIGVPQVADRIAASAGLALRPNTDGPLTHRLRKAWTGLRHIRIV
ncbi:AAA family ATPase [Streptomyces tsukubensis]|uniref:AAA family ATPase n=1 Tax=Streptomyces tsukubensis TaxID=83656 RepID=UPI0036B2CD0A